MRTVAQQWIDEGVQQGMLRGRQKGVREGIEKVARNMLTDGDAVSS